METFAQDPGPHMARLAKIESYPGFKQPQN